MSDIFDDALKITEESVEAQVEANIGTLDTVYQENRALEEEIAQLKAGYTAVRDERATTVKKLERRHKEYKALQKEMTANMQRCIEETQAEIERLNEQKQRKNNVIHQQGLCINEQHDEIERQTEVINLLQKQVALGESEIERLEARADYSEKAYEALKVECEGLQARVEELGMSDFKDTEHSLYLALADIKRLQADNHILLESRRRLQARVEELEKQQDKAAMKRTWNALNAIGIFRCEGCGGEGKRIEKMICGATQTNLGPMRVPCPDCDGRGWVIGGEDE